MVRIDLGCESVPESPRVSGVADEWRGSVSAREGAVSPAMSSVCRVRRVCYNVTQITLIDNKSH